MTDDDHADEAHLVLASLPPSDQLAAVALLDLPWDHPLAAITDGLDGSPVGTLTADLLLADLRTGRATADQVFTVLGANIRPGLTGTT